MEVNRIRNYICYMMLCLFLGGGMVSVHAAEEPLSKSSCALPPDHEPLKYVRVALEKNQKEVIYYAGSSVLLVRVDTGAKITSAYWGSDQVIRAAEKGISIGGKSYPYAAIRIKSLWNSFYLNRLHYRGDVVLIRNTDATITVINYIDLEDYIKGVLPKEVSGTWPLETLKAHAIVSRTFAIFSELTRKENEYSLEKTVASQVYGGKGFEHSMINKAVDATRGKILTYQGRLFPAYFHATCGGKTTAADAVWHIEPHDCLVSVPCAFCKKGRNYRWESDVSLVQIEKGLKQFNITVKGITGIIPAEKDPSGRLIKVTIQSTRGKATISGNALRLAAGANKMKSTKIDRMTITEGTLHMSGAGWGHGVGLCQWGAKGMAEEGYAYKEILNLYYPQAQIDTL